MLKTVFHSENIDFVEVSEELIPDYLTMVNDAEGVQRFIGPAHEPYTAAMEADWVRKKHAENAVVFSMIEQRAGDFIGNIELMDVTDAKAELGIAITAAKQDKGYGTESITRLLEYGFTDLGLRRITLRAYPFNTRAIHVYEKCGFREYARTEEHVCMEVTRESKENV